MGKTNFKSLVEITKTLNDKVEKLSKGKLDVEGVEKLTDSARELYERLVVLRFKSYEGINTEIKIDASKKEISEEKIVELEIAEPVDSLDQSEDDAMMMFDFTESTVESTVEPPIETPSIELESPAERPAENDSKLAGVNLEDTSLNDNFKNDDSSFGDKFTKAKITDLKSYIGINRKFLYINDLFKGDNEKYNAAIDQLNSCESKTDALAILNDLKISEKWEDEDHSVVNFIDIVERRYIS